MTYNNGCQQCRTWIVASVVQYPLDLEQYDRIHQLKQSGLGKVRIYFLWGKIELGSHKHLNVYGFATNVTTWTGLLYASQVILFLSKSDEETTSNRKLAKELVDKWVIYVNFLQYFIHLMSFSFCLAFLSFFHKAD